MLHRFIRFQIIKQYVYFSCLNEDAYNNNLFLTNDEANFNTGVTGLWELKKSNHCPVDLACDQGTNVWCSIIKSICTTKYYCFFV